MLEIEKYLKQKLAKNDFTVEETFVYILLRNIFFLGQVWEK